MIGAPLTPADRLLVRLPNWVGDVVMAEPLVRALVRHRRRTGAPGRIALVGKEPLAELLATRFDDLEVRPARPRAGWRGFSVALLLTGSWSSAFDAWWSRIPRRVGQNRDGRGALLTDRLDPPRLGGERPTFLRRRTAGPLPRPLTYTGRELLWLLGVPVHDPIPSLAPRPQGLERARARRRDLGHPPERPYVLVSAGPKGAKGLDAASVGAALRPVLRARSLYPLVTWGPGEEAAGRELAAALGQDAARCPSPPDLEELLAHAAEARGFVGADSGPRHLARATGTPTLVLFGATDPRHTLGPRDVDRHLFHAPDCGPCHRATCPLDGAAERQCMRAFSAEELRTAAESLLQGA